MPVEIPVVQTTRPRKRKASHQGPTSTLSPKPPSTAGPTEPLPPKATIAQSHLKGDSQESSQTSISKKESKREKKRRKKSLQSVEGALVSPGPGATTERDMNVERSPHEMGGLKYAPQKDGAIEAMRKRMKMADGNPRSHDLSPLAHSKSVRPASASPSVDSRNYKKEEKKKDPNRVKGEKKVVDSPVVQKTTEEEKKDRPIETPTKPITELGISPEERIRKLERELKKQRRLIESHEKAMEVGKATLQSTQTALEASQQALSSLQDKSKSHSEELKEAIIKLDEQIVAVDQKEKTIAGLESGREIIKDALNCQVCFDPLNDPHILSCGHVACKDCLKSWFRTPTAYRNEIPYPVTPTSDLSYRSKLCHVCRAVIIRRPARIYLMQSLLEPLGIIPTTPTLPTLSQDPDGDPWNLTFPPERDTYKITDESDAVDRCPGCFSEIDEGFCATCNREFSDYGRDGMEDMSDLDMGLLDSDGDGGDFGFGSGSEDGSEADRIYRQALFGGDDRRGQPVAGVRRRGRQPPPNLPFDQNEDDHDAFGGLLYNYPRERRRARGGLDLIDVEAADEAGGDGSDDDDDEGDSEDEYGGSFIDDDDIEEVVSDQSDIGIVPSDSEVEDIEELPRRRRDRVPSRAVEEEENEESNSDISVVPSIDSTVGLPIEELRRRRARRFEVNDETNPTPASDSDGETRRRVGTRSSGRGSARQSAQATAPESDSDDSDDEILHVPESTRTTRSTSRAVPRRGRPIVIDDSD